MQLQCEIFDEWRDHESVDCKHQDIMQHRRRRTNSYDHSVYLISTLPLTYHGNGSFAKDAETKGRTHFLGTTWNQMAAHVFAMQCKAEEGGGGGKHHFAVTGPARPL